MEEAEFFTRHSSNNSSCAFPPPELAAAYPAESNSSSGGKYAPRDQLRLWLMHLRARQNIQRIVQIGSGLLIVLIVLVCVFTLVTANKTTTTRRTNGAYKTTRLKSGGESSEDNIGGERSSLGESKSVMLSRLRSDSMLPPRAPLALSDVYISVKTSAKESSEIKVFYD